MYTDIAVVLLREPVPFAPWSLVFVAVCVTRVSRESRGCATSRPRIHHPCYWREAGRRRHTVNNLTHGRWGVSSLSDMHKRWPCSMCLSRDRAPAGLPHSTATDCLPGLQMAHRTGHGISCNRSTASIANRSEARTQEAKQAAPQVDADGNRIAGGWHRHSQAVHMR